MSFCAGCLYLTKYIIPNNFQKEELGSLGGFLSGVVGSMYAVSTGLVLIYLLGNFNKAQEGVAAESIVLMRLADSVGWLPHEMRPTIYLDIKNYTKGVMRREWQLMKDGKQIGHEALSFLQDINKRLQAYKASEQMQLLTKQEIIEEIKELYTVRYNRIKMSYFSLNIQYWIVVCIMTAINLIFVCMFGTKLYLHKISVGLVCITSSSMLLLLFILDKPFRGPFAVNQYDLIKAVHYIERLN
ncbi:DUF4239 domain-containing protein [Rickettsia parkeri]|uniref:bestrophin-like domain n=1 Tax=Rickettsia parkeri TaxID=35792 RepID=UPI0010FC080F|nr:DUF4239 domain-containing protein [Rickettsia parkeri]QCS24168.1 DUF4239 domain-containing protein [Rickettsia parkeri]